MRNGSFEPTKAPAEFSPLEKVMFHGWTVTDSDCWEYNGSIRNPKEGYGRVSQHGKALVVSRVVHEAWIGPIPKGLLVRHKCDNPPCVNPEHLEVGTVRDNARDMIERGRGNPPKGEQNRQAKLTEDDVRHIRQLRDNGRTLQSLADEFHVSLSLVDGIVKRRRWKHVT